MPDSYTNTPAIFPSDETLAVCEATIYQDPYVVKLYEEAWTRIQAA